MLVSRCITKVARRTQRAANGTKEDTKNTRLLLRLAAGAGIEMLKFAGHRWFSACAGVLTLCLAIAACSPSGPAEPPPPAKPVLWGDATMKPVVSVRELMRYTIDPVADNIFNSVRSVMTKKGLEDIEPKTDEDWEKIQSGAVSLVETASLLKIPRPFTPPGDVNNSTGPNPVELSPEQITAKVEKDPVEWNARIEALKNVALEVMDIVKRKDTKELWGAGEDLDRACEACHRSYWYPGENAEFYRGLRSKIEEMRKQSNGEGTK